MLWKVITLPSLKLYRSCWRNSNRCQLYNIYRYCEGPAGDGGRNADYIPQLKNAAAVFGVVCWLFISSDAPGVGYCSVGGQYTGFGSNQTTSFTIQHLVNPLLYSLAVEEHSPDVVHQFVGMARKSNTNTDLAGSEATGRDFSDKSLSARGKPHNPCTSAGLMVTISLIKGAWPLEEVISVVAVIDPGRDSTTSYRCWPNFLARSRGLTTPCLKPSPTNHEPIMLETVAWLGW